MTDYFALFGLTPTFQIDVIDLQARYRELQRAVHPDRHASGSESQRLLAVSRAAELNDALSTLKDPLARAKYLLQRSGAQWRDEHTIQEPAFLFEQLELREQIEQDQSDAQALQLLSTKIAQREREQEKRLSLTFADLSTLHLGQGRSDVQKMMFLRKLRAEIDDRLALLDER